MYEQLGPYRIERLLGRGAMGEVYLARHPVLDREVAIKTLMDLGRQGPGAVARFRREAAAAARLSHPGIMMVYDFAEDQGIHFLVMERVRGEDLQTLIDARSLAPAQAVEVAAQVCEALDHAHRLGIIHRDVKPSNVAVAQEGDRLEAKLLDFGIAQVDDAGTTASGVLMGTAAYLAPERIRGGPATPQSDLFAVGVLLHEALAGRKPFLGENNAHTLFRITSEDAPALETAHLAGLGPGIPAVLARALAKDPAGRFPSGLAMAKALREALAQDPAQPPARPAGSGRILLAIPAAGILLAAGLLLRAPRKAVPAVTLAAPEPAQPLEAPPAPVNPASPARTPPTVPPAAARAETKVEVPAGGREPAAPAPREVAPPPPAPEEVPAEGSPDERLVRARDLVREDPLQAARLLRTLVATRPGDAQIQGTFLAALYFARDGHAFEQALASARAAGVKPRDLLRMPVFRAAIQEESRLRRARSLSTVLPQETYSRLMADLTQEEQQPAGAPRGNGP